MRLDDPRGHLIHGFTRERLRRELRRGAKPATIVLLSFAVAIAGAAYLVGEAAPTLLSSSYEVKVAVDDATAVVPDVNEVRMKGIPVGTVHDVGIEDEQAVITVEIREEYGRIYRDARAELRPNTALNDMYLDIVDRGDPDAGVLEEGETLPRSQTATPVSVSEVLGTFTPTTRQRLRTLLDDLGNGMDDRGRALRGVLTYLTPLIRDAGVITDQLAERRSLVERVVHNANALTETLADRDDQLARLMKDGGATLATLRAGDRDLDATLRELPGAVEALGASLTRVRGTLDGVDGAVDALTPVAERLPAGLDDLERVAETAAPAVRALRRPVTELVPLARDLRPLSAALADAAITLKPQVPAIDKTTTSAVGCKTAIQNFFQWNASIVKFGDSRGPAPRGNLVVGAQSSSVLADPNEVRPQACAPGTAIGGRPAREEDKG